MWFARLFGGRDERDDYEEPTAVAPPPQRPAEKAPVTAVSRPSPVSSPSAAKPKGFDPYNSGQFERRNAWERVTRR